jgi:hypothetical protein
MATLYTPFFVLMGAVLMILHLLLVLIVSLHTAWLFNNRVAARLLPPKQAPIS